MRGVCYVLFCFTLIVMVPAGSAGAVTHVIDIGDNFFSPLKTVAQPGDTILWNWVGSFPHSSTSDGGSPKVWDSGTKSGSGNTFSLVIAPTDGLGPFPYHCSVHSSTMKDTIFVEIPGASTKTINIGDNFFSPLKTNVQIGDTVQWNWVGSFPHSTTSDAGAPKAWDSGILSGGGNSFLIVIQPADGAGPFPYHCAVHFTTMLDTLFGDPDTDNDGIDDSDELSLSMNPYNTDSDGDHVPDDIEIGSVLSPLDTDNDLIIDALDTDDDGDGILTINEDANMNGDPTDDDSDGDMIPDYLDDVNNGSCCLGNTGNIDGDATDGVDISDLLYLVDYQFTPGSPAPPCNEEADVDGSGAVDISDLLYLVDYQFTPGSPAPVACP